MCCIVNDSTQHTTMSCKSFIWIIYFYLIHSLTLVHPSCDSFLEPIQMTLVRTDNSISNESVFGCIDNTKFQNRSNIRRIKIEYQKLPVVFKEGTVNNLADLEYLYIDVSRILTAIEPFAFKNISKIKSITVRYCKVKEITRNIYDILPTLEIIVLNNNLIDLVGANAFANLPLLKQVDLNKNSLDHWNRDWFTNSTNLEILRFSYNSIRTIPRKAFEDLTKLNKIYFNHNELSNIQPDAFKGIRELKYLSLQHNKLKTINANVIPSRLYIESLFLSANYLNFLPSELLNRLVVKEVRLFNNPWKCPCLDTILHRLQVMSANNYVSDLCFGDNIPVCAFPLTYSRTCIEEVDDQVIKVYLDAIRSLKSTIPSYCTRLD